MLFQALYGRKPRFSPGAVAALHGVRDSIQGTPLSTAKFGCRPCTRLASLPKRFTVSWGTGRERAAQPGAATCQSGSLRKAARRMLEGLRKPARQTTYVNTTGLLVVQILLCLTVPKGRVAALVSAGMRVNTGS